jgi:lipopolysaccharide export system protein LptA
MALPKTQYQIHKAEFWEFKGEKTILDLKIRGMAFDSASSVFQFKSAKGFFFDEEDASYKVSAERASYDLAARELNLKDGVQLLNEGKGTLIASDLTFYTSSQNADIPGFFEYFSRPSKPAERSSLTLSAESASYDRRDQVIRAITRPHLLLGDPNGVDLTAGRGEILIQKNRAEFWGGTHWGSKKASGRSETLSVEFEFDSSDQKFRVHTFTLKGNAHLAVDPSEFKGGLKMRGEHVECQFGEDLELKNITGKEQIVINLDGGMAFASMATYEVGNQTMVMEGKPAKVVQEGKTFYGRTIEYLLKERVFVIKQADVKFLHGQE